MESLGARISRYLNMSHLLNCARSNTKGPMGNGEKFLVLDEDYINKFEEIVVIGDIHGCCDEFEDALNKIHSESPTKKPNKTLKILVGDLVNKGPLSKKVLHICTSKYPKSIITVRGNHDELALELYERYKKDKKIELKDPSTEYIKSMPARYISYLNRLPYTISIPSLKCIIVHAGLQPFIEEPAKNTATYLMCSMRNVVVEKNSKTGEISYNCTKSHEQGAAWATFWPGPEHVYFGHDARRRLQNDHEFATGLDTGCVYGDRLSYIYIKGTRKGEIVSIPARKMYVDSSKDSETSKENIAKEISK